MTIADTSALLPLLLEGHPHRKQAMAALGQGAVTVTWGTLLETSVLVRRQARLAGRPPNREARAALLRIVGLAGFRDAPPTDLRGVLATYTSSPTLSFNDAWVLHLARTTGEALLTFDRALATAYGRGKPAGSV